MALVGSIGWGLLAWGAGSHLAHPTVLTDLLGAHFTNPRSVALALTAVQVALAAAIPVAVVSGSGLVAPLALAGGLVGVGFTLWVGRLLATGSTLPCACSFSGRPPTAWSLLRAFAVVATAALAVGGLAESRSELVASLAVGLGVAGALYLLPEALQWPPALRAQMARFDSTSEAGG